MKINKVSLTADESSQKIEFLFVIFNILTQLFLETQAHANNYLLFTLNVRMSSEHLELQAKCHTNVKVFLVKPWTATSESGRGARNTTTIDFDFDFGREHRSYCHQFGLISPQSLQFPFFYNYDHQEWGNKKLIQTSLKCVPELLSRWRNWDYMRLSTCMTPPCPQRRNLNPGIWTYERRSK